MAYKKPIVLENGKLRELLDGDELTGVNSTAVLPMIIDGGEDDIGTRFAIGPGKKGDIFVPFNCQITGVHALADQSGSITVDIRVGPFSNTSPSYPGASESITSGTPPSLSGNTKYSDTTLTGWSKNIAANSIVRFYVPTQASNVTQLSLNLVVRKTNS